MEFESNFIIPCRNVINGLFEANPKSVPMQQTLPHQNHRFAKRSAPHVNSVVPPPDRPRRPPAGALDSRFHVTSGVHGKDVISQRQSRYLEAEPFLRQIVLRCRGARSFFESLGRVDGSLRSKVPYARAANRTLRDSDSGQRMPPKRTS